MTIPAPKILIVDDQENNRLLIADILKKLKPDFQMATSGEEALNLVKEWMPHLILMDQMMPGLSGTDTIIRIKSQSRFEHVPIIMVTARSDINFLKDAFESGVVDYVMKPIDKMELLTRVTSALKTKSAFDKIQLLTQELIIQKQELSSFTSVVSHDLKSPLASASSLFDFFLYRLKEEYPELVNHPDFGELLHRIPTALNKMLNFIDTLLEYAHAGKLIGEGRLISMKNIVQDVISDFEHVVTKGDVVFDEINGMPDAFCDPLKMQQVWQNLIGNAIKYRGHQNPVTIKIGGREENEILLFWIEDNGPGIPAEYHTAIFQPFVRLEYEVEGTGIGLATVRKILQAHQGSIIVDPQHTKGTRFLMKLPIKNFDPLQK